MKVSVRCCVWMESIIEERTGAAKAIVPRKKKKEMNEETRIVGCCQGCYEWVNSDESLTRSIRAFIHGIRFLFYF